tara:strand:+ start:5779 stop:6120 length:342 start_codon:yes stop_codon:yes gene_type:complete
MSDVFCKGCRYYEFISNFTIEGYTPSAKICTNINNSVVKKSALEKYENYPDIDYVNSKNDCKLFEPILVKVSFINRVFSKISLWYGLAFDCDEPMYVEPELGGGMCKETGMPE